MLKRISHKKPAISRERQETDWEQNLRFMNNISAFPEDWYLRDRPKSNPNLSSRSNKEKQSTSEEEEKTSTEEEKQRIHFMQAQKILSEKLKSVSNLLFFLICINVTE